MAEEAYSEDPNEKHYEADRRDGPSDQDAGQAQPPMTPPPSESDSPPTPSSRTETANTNRDWFDYVKFAAEIVGLAVVIAYTVFSALQWLTMNDTLKEIKQQTSSTRTSADAAKSAAETARRALESSTSSLQIDERPYIVDDGEGWIEGRDPGPHEVHRTIFFKNIGKTPAIRIKTYACLVAINGPGSRVDYVPDIKIVTDALFVAARRQIEKQEAFGADRAPQERFIITARLMNNRCQTERPMRVDEFQAFIGRTTALELVAGVIYGDVFGIQHETQICHVLLGTPEASPFCTEHNFIR